MNIEKTDVDGIVTLRPDGWLDAVNSVALGEVIDTITSGKELILDLEAVEYIASSGVRQIVVLYKKAGILGAGVKVINVCPEVMSILKLTGIDKKIEIVEKE